MAGAISTRFPYLALRRRMGVVLCTLLAFSPCLLSQGSKGFQINTDEHNASPTRRLALVIGNKDYPWKPLVNPVNDATDVAGALEQAGFKGNIQRVFNAPHDAMKRAVRDFVASVHPGDFAFVYYSGHGVEVKGINYLLPVDIPANATSDEVEDDGVSAQRIASDLDDRGAAVKVIVLDACRDNPIKASRSAAGGLAPMEGLGSLIVFATEAGRTASDNNASRNGLFTQYLLKALAARGVSLDDAVRDVARQMAADTNRQQVPAIYGLLERPVYLFTGPVTINTAPGPSAPDPALEAWNAIEDSHNPQDFDDFVAGFPQSPYVPTARLAANRLRRETSAAKPGATPAGAGQGAFTLVVNCDLPCKWQIDGEEKGAIESGDVARVQVPPGDHILRAVTSDGRDHTSQNVTGSGNTTKVVSLSLTPFREQRTVMAQAEATQGENYRKQQDYPHALAAFQEACTDGDATGCFGIAYMYHTGTGVSQDYKKAGDFFNQSCDLGKMMGCKYLGYLYGMGFGVPMDRERAFALYKQACDGGEAQGCQYLGSMYFDGVGAPQSYSMALSLFKHACDGNNLDACDYLGDMYKRGESVQIDISKARQFYDQACKGGNDTACTNLKALDTR